MLHLCCPNTAGCSMPWGEKDGEESSRYGALLSCHFQHVAHECLIPPQFGFTSESLSPMPTLSQAPCNLVVFYKLSHIRKKKERKNKRMCSKLNFSPTSPVSANYSCKRKNLILDKAADLANHQLSGLQCSHVHTRKGQVNTQIQQMLTGNL